MNKFATVLEVVHPRDPIAGKGVFHFTPASGRAWVAFQARFDLVRVTLTNTRGPRFEAVQFPPVRLSPPP